MNTSRLYMIIAAATGIAVSILILVTAQGNDDTSLSVLSATSKRALQSISACKGGTINVNGNSAQLQQGKTMLFAKNATYDDRAARGYLNNDAFNDIICLYDLTDDAGAHELAVAGFIGVTGGQFSSVGALEIPNAGSSTAISLEGGNGTVSYKDASGISREFRFYLEGDMLIQR